MIKSLLSQDGDEGQIIIETEEYEGTGVFYPEDGVIIETLPGIVMEDVMEDTVMEDVIEDTVVEDVIEDTVVEEGIVEDDGIKYETQLVSL